MLSILLLLKIVGVPIEIAIGIVIAMVLGFIAIGKKLHLSDETYTYSLIVPRTMPLPIRVKDFQAKR